MQKLFTTLLVLGLSSFLSQPPLYSQPKNTRLIQIQIHPNVEMLGFVYFLGYEGAKLEKDDPYLENSSIRRSEWYSYGFSLYQQYKHHQSSEHVAVIMRCAERIWLDYLINLLLQLDHFPKAKLNAEIDERYYLRFSPTSNPEEAWQTAGQFIDAMNQFYLELDFDKYLRDNKKRYDNALAQVKLGLPGRKFVPAMEAFYRQRFDAYTFVPSLTIPTGMGFGLSYTLEQKDRTFHVFGPFKPQQFHEETSLNMGFDNPKHLFELSTHEFGHSFVNPVIDGLPPDLIHQTANLFGAIRQAMENQGYTSWKACLYEHFVRAGEIMIAQSMGHSKRAARLKAHYITNRHFIYLDTILSEMEIYNGQHVYSYPQAVEKTMQQLHKWGSQSPYRQVSHSIREDDQWLNIQVKGIRRNNEKVQYEQRFPVEKLTSRLRDSLKFHVLDSLRITSRGVNSRPETLLTTEVTFDCSSCGRSGQLEVYGSNFVATRKITFRRGVYYRFPVYMHLAEGNYRLVYRSWPSKPIQSVFHIKDNKQATVIIK